MIHSFLPANPFALARTWKIFAGAGAGKTRAIQQTMGDLITSGVAPREIMYLLFNRKPADTFREKWNLTKLDMQWWNTHHSICKQLLGRNCQILDIEEWGKTRGFKLSNDPYKEENGASGWDMAYSEVQRRIFMDELAGATASERKLFDALRQTEYEEKKFCHARYLEKALKLDLFPPGVKYVFVDEAQDNGKIQMDWLTRVAARPEVLGMMIAGDDKQAINGFKGASAELFLNFQTEAEVELTTTYRNGKQIMLEANRLVKPIKNRSSLTSFCSTTNIPAFSR